MRKLEKLQYQLEEREDTLQFLNAFQEFNKHIDAEDNPLYDDLRQAQRYAYASMMDLYEAGSKLDLFIKPEIFAEVVGIMAETIAENSEQTSKEIC